MGESILFQAMVYLAAAILIVPLAKRIGLGSVLGYLLAGVLIGPFLLNFIGERGDDLLHFAEFGVVMMLFLIGMELQPRLLWRMRMSILGMGGTQVGVTTLVIFGIGLAFNLNWQQALAVGMTFSLSSTAIVLQTLAERDVMDTQGGRAAFSVLLFQDIAVIPMLALMPLLVVGSEVLPGLEAGEPGHEVQGLLDGLPAAVRAVITLLSVGVVILAGRYLIPPLMGVVAKTRQRELLTGAALLLVVSVAVLMTLVGLSPALGAFVGGVVLANSPYRHEIESDLEPFKGLLLGLFFMAVGASIDFALVAAQPLPILGFVLLLIGVKAIILFGIGKAFGFGLDQNLLFSLGLAQTGEFAFVLLAVISGNAILPPETTSLLTVIVAISMAVTPLLMILNDRVLQPRLGVTESAAVALDEMDDINVKRRVIVAGFGLFGAVVGRFLGANGVRATILDNDSDRVAVLRKMGFEVYYGDATRFDLLETAGAESADILIVGLANAERNLAIVRTAKKHFPHLKLLVRALEYDDTYDLLEEGVEHIYRDTIKNGLDAAGGALGLLGMRAHQINRNAKRFLQHDEAALRALAQVRNDPDRYAKTVRGRVSELENQLRTDLPSNRMPDGEWMGLDRDTETQH